MLPMKLGDFRIANSRLNRGQICSKEEELCSTKQKDKRLFGDRLMHWVTTSSNDTSRTMYSTTASPISCQAEAGLLCDAYGLP